MTRAQMLAWFEHALQTDILSFQLQLLLTQAAAILESHFSHSIQHRTLGDHWGQLL